MGIKKKLFFWVDVVLMAVCLSYSIHRDLQITEQTFGTDLRNRVVGARLQEDGKDPYFYKWDKHDDYKYYTPRIDSHLKVNGVTTTPFFNYIFSVICNLPQHTILKIMLWLQYALLLLICFLFTQFAEHRFQKLFIANICVLFTYTAAWKLQIYQGQIYFIFGVLIGLIIYGLLKREKNQYILLAAVSTAILVLIRPYALVILLPFIFQFKTAYKYIIASCAMIALYGLFVVFNKREQSLWLTYRESLQEHIKRHQGLNPTIRIVEPSPDVAQLEGFDFSKAKPLRFYSEHGNVFHIYSIIFHQKLPLQTLYILFFVSTLLLLAAFGYYQYKNGFQFERAILLGALLYMVADFFSPIHRYQYYTTQWFAIILFGMLFFKKWPNLIQILLILGIILNITNTPLIPMRHSLGEYLWLISLLLIVFKKPTNTVGWKLQ